MSFEKYVKFELDFHIIWGHYHFVFDHPNEMYFHRKRVLEIMKDVDFEKRKCGVASCYEKLAVVDKDTVLSCMLL